VSVAAVCGPPCGGDPLTGVSHEMYTTHAIIQRFKELEDKEACLVSCLEWVYFFRVPDILRSPFIL
jgi:hypothetical protein